MRLSKFNMGVGIAATILGLRVFTDAVWAETVFQELFIGVQIIIILLFAIMLILIRNGEVAEEPKKK